MKPCTRVVRVTRRITKLSLRHGIKTPAVTQKCLPFFYEGLQHGSIDLKSIENAAVEMVVCDVAAVGLCVAYVLIKNMSRNNSGFDPTQDKKNDGPEPAPPRRSAYHSGQVPRDDSGYPGKQVDSCG